MSDSRLKQLAGVIVNYSTKVKPGELVVITGEPNAAGLAAVEAIFEAVLKAGGHPSFHPKAESLQEAVLKFGNEEQIKHVSPFEWHRLEHCDVFIMLICPSNTKYLNRMDPAKVAMNQAARKDLFTMSTKRAADGKVRYCLTEIPTLAAAQDAGMSLAQYEDFVYGAGFLDHPDPVASWKKLGEQQQRAVDFLNTKKEIRFRAPPRPPRNGNDGNKDGTDLIVDVTGRTWINCPGDSNFPDGEVFSGPRSADGIVNFTYPVIYRGVEMRGIRMKFAAGRAIEASADKGEDHLIRLLDQDAGARFMGEIAIGTNYSLRESVNNILFDEKIGGTFHAAVGKGFLETGSTNESGLHMDMVCCLRSGGEIFADGELIQRDGVFLMDGWPAPHL